jgi:hypothetical protein
MEGRRSQLYGGGTLKKPPEQDKSAPQRLLVLSAERTQQG